jgi:hypothetical protein
VEAKLTEYQRTIRPVAWGVGDAVFRGTLRPWLGATIAGAVVPSVGLADLSALFDALQNLPSGPGLPTIRAGEAMVLWVMEGRLRLGAYPVDGVVFDMLKPGAATSWLPVEPGLFSGFPFPPADLTAATDAAVRSLLRSALLWFVWGMDVFTTTVKPPGADTDLKWEATLAASAAGHDTKLRNGLKDITDTGLTAPTEAALNAAIELRPGGPGKEFRLTPGYIRTNIWLQYAEYLRRQIAYTSPAIAMPVAAREVPEFNYIAFNGGLVQAAQYWAEADTTLAGAPPSWVKTHEDALRLKRLTAWEESRTPRLSTDRSAAPRVNGLHFGALARTYGAVFPRVLYP